MKFFAGKRSALRARSPAADADFASVFDRDWYGRTYLTGQSNADPFAHFLSRVELTEFAPNALFDAQWYFEQYPEAKASGALRHYLTIGSGNGHSPGPLFDEVWYRTNYADAQQSHISGLAHYMTTGKLERRHTNPWLSDPDRSGSPFAVSLNADLDQLDLLNISENYVDPTSVYAAKDRSMFFEAQQRRWMAMIESRAESNLQVEPVLAAIAIGGSRKIFRIGSSRETIKHPRTADRQMWHFQRVRIGLLPFIHNSVHLLGLSCTEFPDRVREYIDARRESRETMDISLLIDARKKSEWQRYVRNDPYYRLICIGDGVAVRLRDTIVVN